MLGTAHWQRLKPAGAGCPVSLAVEMPSSVSDSSKAVTGPASVTAGPVGGPACSTSDLSFCLDCRLQPALTQYQGQSVMIIAAELAWQTP